MWQYTEKVMDHFLKPRNIGEIEDADAVGTVGSLQCGDMLKLSLKIENNIITDAKFKTFGCASAIASSSALTELIKGKTVEEALNITNRDITDYLGGLPDQKLHCSVMGQEALESAMKDYYEKQGKEMPRREEYLVCKCFGLSNKDILSCIEKHQWKTLNDVMSGCKAGSQCGKCKGEIQNLLEHHLGETVIKEQKKEQ